VLHRFSTIASVRPASLDLITRYRTGGGIFTAGPFNFLYAIRTVPQSAASATPTKRLELYPTPAAAETAALTGEYTRFVPKLTGGTNVADIGVGCFPTLRRLCRALAISTEEERAGEDWRAYERGLAQCKLRDGDEQPNLGPIEGGVSDYPMAQDSFLYPTRISPA